MSAIESLNQIRPIWKTRIITLLTHGELLRTIFQEQLDQFYELIIQSVTTGNPGWMDVLLSEWIAARTQSEINETESSLASIVENMFLATSEIARNIITERETLGLLNAVTPVYLHAIDYIYAKETEFHVDHISQKLEQARISLERLDKSKSDFIAIAAHELKTPLTLLEGYTAMLHEQVEQLNEIGQAPILLKGIEQGTKRLREIINDMIDVSIIDNDMLSLHFQPIWINRLINLIVQEFEDVIADRRQNLQIKTFPAMEEMTFADEERLYQALRNLVSNAIKYTPDGGTVTIGGRSLPGFIELTISDTGIGIDPEDQVRIFDKFSSLGSVTLHSSGKTKFKGGGPGLGLPITKGIIESHGGTIWVESEGYNEVTYPGATFHVLLPILKASPDDKLSKLFRISTG